MKNIIISLFIIVLALADLAAQSVTGYSQSGPVNITRTVPLVVVWQGTTGNPIISDSTHYRLTGRFEIDIQLQHIKIYVNGQLQTPGRGFSVTPAQKNQLDVWVPLQPGPNTIVVETSTDQGRAVSAPLIVEYRSAQTSSAGKRFALVIGNSNYVNAPLRNPVNDAKSMSESLQKTGFSVSTYTDCSFQQMKKAIVDFGSQIASDKQSVGLFFYAGHGLQSNGANYLVPVDAVIEKEAEIPVYAVSLEDVMAQFDGAGNSMNIIILDACRNNPFSASGRSVGGRGFSVVAAPAATFIAFSTAPGQIASDGEGDNGLYTSELVNAMLVPGLRIEDVFKRVRAQVKVLSDGKQIPWENSSIDTDFYFIAQ